MNKEEIEFIENFQIPYALKLGDKVRIIKLTNDSASSTDLYGVEPHLNSWINIYYLEPFEGVVEFDTETLMIVVKGSYTKIPLSPSIRFNLYTNDFEEHITLDQLNEIKEELGVVGMDLESIIDYVIKI